MRMCLSHVAMAIACLPNIRPGIGEDVTSRLHMPSCRHAGRQAPSFTRAQPNNAVHKCMLACMHQLVPVVYCTYKPSRHVDVDTYVHVYLKLHAHYLYCILHPCRYGPGAVIYWFGYVRQLASADPAVLLLDAFPHAADVTLLPGTALS